MKFTKKSLLAVATFCLVIFGMGAGHNYALAAVCDLQVSLIENGQAVKATSVNINDYQKFGLRVATTGCFASEWVRVNFKVGNGGLQVFSAPVQSPMSQDFTFGKPGMSTITYIAEKSASGSTWGVLDSGYIKKELTVNWVTGTTPTPVGNPSGPTGTTTTTSPATSTTTGPQEAAGLSNSQINSGVTVSTNQSLDTILGTFSNPLEFETVPELIIRLINIGLLLAAMVTVIVIIVGGFNLVTAAGNETKITKGKRSIMWAIAGLIVCLLSFSIVAIIQKVVS